MNARILLTSLAIAVVLSSSATAQKHGARHGKRTAPAISASFHSQRSSSYRGSRYGRAGRHRQIRSAVHRTWIPGRYTTGHRRVWIPERHERVWVGPVFGWSLDSRGLRIRIVTSAGYWDDVYHPGYYDHSPVRDWSPGYWRYR